MGRSGLEFATASIQILIGWSSDLGQLKPGSRWWRFLLGKRWAGNKSGRKGSNKQNGKFNVSYSLLSFYDSGVIVNLFP